MRIGDVRAFGASSEVHGLGGVSTRADRAEQQGWTPDSAVSFEVAITPEVTSTKDHIPFQPRTGELRPIQISRLHETGYPSECPPKAGQPQVLPQLQHPNGRQNT